MSILNIGIRKVSERNPVEVAPFLSFIRYRAQKFSLLFLLFAGLTACSSTRLLYTFAEGFIEDEIKYFLDLRDEEGTFINQQIEKLVDWHRTSMLPRYATYLNSMADKLGANRYGSSDVAASVATGRSLIAETVRGITPRASRVLVRHLEPDDIAHMQKKMAERREERIEALSEPENKRLSKRVERLVSNFERFLGNLTEEQVELLDAHARVTLDEKRIWLKNQTLRQKVFIAFLSTSPSEAELTKFLDRLLLRGHEITNPDYEEFSEARLERFQKLLVKIMEFSTPMQRKMAIENLRSYASDFLAVAG